MRGWLALCTGIIFFFFMASATFALAGDSPNGGAAAGFNLEVVPDPGESAATVGAVGDMTFWSLPPVVQLAIFTGLITGLVLSAFAVGKLLPAVLGKLQNLLENRNRKRIYTYVEQNPGCTIPEISRNESLNIGTVKHHAGMLERSMRITSVRIGKFIRLFKRSEDYSDGDKLVASAVKNVIARHILIAVRDNPGITNSELAEMLDIKESTAHWHTRRFLSDGIIRSEKVSKMKRLYLSEEVVPTLDRMTK